MGFVSFAGAEHEAIAIKRPGHRIKNDDAIISTSWREEGLIAARPSGA
jgi:hypothetical protein